MYTILPAASHNGFVIQIQYRPDPGSLVSFMAGKRLLRTRKGAIRRFETAELAADWLSARGMMLLAELERVP